MRQRLTIILTIVVVIGLLVLVNVITHVKEENPRDSELMPKRSTYHSGPTGVRALYDYLSESGYKVMRWRETPGNLLKESGQRIETFVVVGPPQVAFTDDESQALLQWTHRGGRLVIIDRWPTRSLLVTGGNWHVTADTSVYPTDDIDPGNPRDMTESVVALQPVQPTLLTENVQSIMPSRYGARFALTSEPQDKAKVPSVDSGQPTAPVVHIADGNGPILLDYSYGSGRIVLLGDPYIVANGGISLNDNLRLAINTLQGVGGLIAFDEYHQGRGISANPFASYFAGTPVLAIAAQLVVLALFMVWTKARRFARPLPLVEVDRRSSLEFVASMSELQERSHSYDLAIENIYSRTRRVLSRYAGTDYNSPRAVIASRVALRSALDARQLETLMRQCEEVINGAPVNWRQSLDLARRLREVERTLGLRMRSRDVRQAAERI